MKQREGRASYIHTPVELDLAFRALERRFDRAASPLTRFSLLTDFLSHTAEVPSAWLASYGRNLFQRLAPIVGHPYVSGGDPQRWNTVLRFLDQAAHLGWIQRREQLAQAQDAACAQMIFAHVCVRAFRPLHEALCLRRFHLRDLPESDWSAVLNADTLGHDAFEQYVRRAVPAEVPVPPPIDAALQRWRHAREPGSISVVLLDQSDTDVTATGTVLRLDLRSSRSAGMHVHITSGLASDNTETTRQLHRCATLAAGLIRRRFGAPPPREYTLSFHERGAEFRGESMGLAAALLIAVDMQRGFNRDVRWHLAPQLVCTGGLAEDGAILPAPASALRHKVEIAFFSHADRLVLAAGQREEGIRIVRALQQRFPARQLEILGVATFDECASAESILRHERRAISDRAFTFARRHTVALLISVLVLLGGYTGFLLWKYYYDYPDLEKTVGGVDKTSSIVFNPKSSPAWTFRDKQDRRPGIMPFGDLEVGDGYFRNFYIYNFGRFPLEIDITIDGPDAEEWYCNWNGGRQTVASANNLRMMVMFAPVRPAAHKSARLVLRDADSGAELYALLLQGSAGPPERAGSAMRLDGVDDMLVFGKNSTAFGMEDATVEMWLRPDSTAFCFYSDTYNPPDGQTVENMTFSFRQDTLSIAFASIRASVKIPPTLAVRSGAWTHVAFSYRHPLQESPGRLTVFINGEIIFDREDEFMLENIRMPHVTIGAFHDGYVSGGHFRGDIDEVRLWRGYRTAEEIREYMHVRVPARTPGLRGYWDMDQPSEEDVFAAYKLSPEAEPVGWPAQARSAAPINAPAGTGVHIVDGPRGGKAVEIDPFVYLHCAQQVLTTDTGRTYAVWYRQDAARENLVLAVANQDSWALIENGKVSIVGDVIAVPMRREGWNHALLRVDRRQRVEYFLNGKGVGRSDQGDFHRGPFYRYYGLQLGFFYDGYNNLRAMYYDASRPRLTTPRAVADLCVWERRLTDEEISGLLEGRLPERGLIAHWPLNRLPDEMGNFLDTRQGHPMHVRRVRGWE